MRWLIDALSLTLGRGAFGATAFGLFTTIAIRGLMAAVTTWGVNEYMRKVVDPLENEMELLRGALLVTPDGRG